MKTIKSIPTEDFFLKHKHKTKSLIRFEINEKLVYNELSKRELIYVLEILYNMSQKSMEVYKKGKVLTVGELKLLPENSIIHLWYQDEDNNLRNNDFVSFYGYTGDDELFTNDGYPMPLNGHEDDELIENFDNCGWKFTVCEALLNSK